VSSLLGVEKPTIITGSLAPRDITVRVDILGNPMTTIKSTADNDLKQNPDDQQLWYTNSATNAKDGMYNATNKLLEKNQNRGGPQTVVDTMTGGDGIKWKVCSMKAFTSYSKQRRLEYGVKLDNTQILFGTSAVNAGVSSNDLTQCKHKGFPPSMYNLCQEMGSVNRLLLAIAGTNTYGIHISFDSAVLLYVRIMKNKSAIERNNLLVDMQEVLMGFITPDECYHSYIERYFETDPEEKEGCGLYCSFCTGEVKEFTGRFYKDELVSINTMDVFTNGINPKYRCFIKAMKAKKDILFHKEDIPSVRMGPIHAIALQLLSKGIISFSISDKTRIGDETKLNDNHVIVTLPVSKNTRGTPMSAT